MMLYSKFSIAWAQVTPHQTPFGVFTIFDLGMVGRFYLLARCAAIGVGDTSVFTANSYTMPCLCCTSVHARAKIKLSY